MTIWKLKFLPSFSKFITLCSNVQECNNTRIYAKCYAGAKIERFSFSFFLFLFFSPGRTNFSLADAVKTGIRLFLRRKILPGVIGLQEPRLARRSAQNF